MGDVETVLREAADLQLAPVPALDAIAARAAQRRRARRLAAAATTALVAAVLSAAALAWVRDGPVSVRTLEERHDTRALPCPGSVPRRALGGDSVSADGLPNVEASVTDRAVAARVLAAHEAEIRGRYRGVEYVTVGPGFGRAWEGVNGGDYRIVDVPDYGIDVVLRSRSDCPTGTALHTGISGVPLFFTTR